MAYGRLYWGSIAGIAWTLGIAKTASKIAIVTVPLTREDV
jgi:hypothetical protein